MKETDWSRLFRFGTVGALAVFVYYLALWLMVEHGGVGVLAATSLAFLLVATENYILHYRWTFASSNLHTVAFPQFLLMNIAGFFINWTIMYVGVSVLMLHYVLVQAVSIAVVFTWNYVLSHFWIFRED